MVKELEIAPKKFLIIEPFCISQSNGNHKGKAFFQEKSSFRNIKGPSLDLARNSHK